MPAEPSDGDAAITDEYNEMLTGHPRVSVGLEIHETEDGLVIYLESTNRVHHLNHTAAVVLHLCDGSRAGAEIATAMAQVFGLSEPPIDETRDCLVDLAREHLIEIP